MRDLNKQIFARQTGGTNTEEKTSLATTGVAASLAQPARSFARQVHGRKLLHQLPAGQLRSRLLHDGHRASAFAEPVGYIQVSWRPPAEDHHRETRHAPQPPAAVARDPASAAPGCRCDPSSA